MFWRARSSGLMGMGTADYSEAHCFLARYLRAALLVNLLSSKQVDEANDWY